jgi:hypothetical protein
MKYRPEEYLFISAALPGQRAGSGVAHWILISGNPFIADQQSTMF